jgi:enoyl-CoA hydratase/carnithine racemase
MAAVEFDVPEAGIARITLHRPEVLNAIDGARLDGLDVALDRLGWLHPL